MDINRNYTKFDLLRFLTFANENKKIHRIELLKLYDKKYPELTAKEKLNNLLKVFNSCPKCFEGEPFCKEYEYNKTLNYCDACGTYSTKIII